METTIIQSWSAVCLSMCLSARLSCCLLSHLSVAIDNTLPYGYETNHVSALISIKSSSSILVLHTKKDLCRFVALRNDERLQVLQVVYTGGFVDYLVGKTTNCKWIQNVEILFSHFCHRKISQLFSWIVALSLRFVLFRHGECYDLCLGPFCRIL